MSSSPTGRCGRVRNRIVVGVAAPAQDRRNSALSAIGSAAGQATVEAPASQLTWLAPPPWVRTMLSVTGPAESARHRVTLPGSATQTAELLATSTCQMLG